MRLTKYTHACIRVDDGSRSLVIDPGTWTEPGALLGADAVLITHEHHDHVDVMRLSGLGLPAYVPRHARLRAIEHTRGLDLHVVDAADDVEVAGFSVRAVGGTHAPVLPGQEVCANLGYVIHDAGGDTVFHPGDALHVPSRDELAGRQLRVLCAPVQASWVKLAEVVEFVDAVAADVTIGVHDGQVNERGLDGITHYLSRRSTTRYVALRPRQELR
ncbi:L-ascorbate metabolism protein UlaG, beta-lactamase superfamily [Quadrisphaera granulorum]|uniref:L-ascorbate metabolism protein UlaG (Beta-lactamase superfamily) n=1 Tax=Quadrisphaera granulorum TaxID=317664 RepID=A0A315ZQD5_9ACTN|nr:MBL fold metallo-hydrolase [Quadrisphaera granulorum]PWJ47108.1 L-ascorbate metabolism protein UlaG (beta-lactamase superfamily) [Quadrisphaera granulorum]SZE98912.1 L-ascorbate metabolism protein UlaG, beta-lactamase superfamily [Quadrisphaera granulorum]